MVRPCLKKGLFSLSLFLSFFCPIIIYQEVAVEFKVGSEYIVSYLECQQLLGSVGQF